MNEQKVEEVADHIYLGLTFVYNLRWHINDICVKARKRLILMIPLKFKLDRHSVETMYNSFVRPTMEYANVNWEECMTMISRN